MQSNDVLVNLITGVSFLRKICLKKSHRFPSAATFHFVAIVKIIGVLLNMSFHFFILESLIPFPTLRLKNECLGSVENESKQKGGKIKKTKRRERRRGKRIAKSQKGSF
jgi:hypothetical protein